MVSFILFIHFSVTQVKVKDYQLNKFPVHLRSTQMNRPPTIPWNRYPMERACIVYPEWKAFLVSDVDKTTWSYEMAACIALWKRIYFSIDISAERAILYFPHVD